jgi:hypothetical protein
MQVCLDLFHVREPLFVRQNCMDTLSPPGDTPQHRVQYICKLNLEMA